MNNQQAYNLWAESYDDIQNKTRDIEAKAIRTILSAFNFSHILEIGCGTGKNTEWFVTKADLVTSVDFSAEMLNKAKNKIKSDKVKFIQTDITKGWNFVKSTVELASCSLILEHIENIDFIFGQVNNSLKKDGLFYIGELHPFKQYAGSKARFETNGGTFELECHVHHISDYFDCAKRNGFECVDIKEWFDEDDRTNIPRVLTMLFRKI